MRGVRGTVMRRLRALLATGMLVILVVFALCACSGAGGGSEEQVKGRPLPEDQEPLRPGQYHSVEFKPPLSFKVGKGWATDSPETSDTLPLGRGDQGGGMSFANVKKVYKPTETGTPKLVEAPKDLAGWLLNHPYIETSKPEPITVGGVKGRQFDLVAKGVPEDHYSLCGTNCVDIYQVSTGNAALFEGEKLHSIVLEDVEGETVYIDFGPEEEKGSDYTEAQKVVESVKWAGS
jgi:hypothetical protein